MKSAPPSVSVDEAAIAGFPEAAHVAPGGFEPSRIEIDMTALQDNFDALRKHAGPGRKFIAVVKADGYGHGAVAVARSLAGRPVDFFAAGSVAEAIAVRAAAPRTPVIILGSLLPAESREVVEYGLIASVDQAGSAKTLSEVAGNRPATVFVKVDAGFGRFGVSMAEAPAFIRWLAGLSGLILGGVYTHLPFSDVAGRAWAARQGRMFDEIIAALRAENLEVPVVQSLASPGLATALADRGNAIAVGHLLYGMAPVADSLDADIGGYRPALRTISTTLVHLSRRLPGDSAAPYLRAGIPDGLLGVVPIGIHHGYRPFAPAAHVLVGGVHAPVLRPCLENTILDLSEIPRAAVGDEVVLVGTSGDARIKLSDLAAWQGTSPLAMLAGLGRALPRRLVMPAAALSATVGARGSSSPHRRG